MINSSGFGLCGGECEMDGGKSGWRWQWKLHYKWPTCKSFLRPTFFALLSWPSVLISDSVSLTSHQGMFGCPRKYEKKRRKKVVR